MNIQMLASLICFGCLPVSLTAQSVNTEAANRSLLTIRSIIPISTPPFSFHKSECDASGNVVFDLTGSTYTKELLLRVSHDGQTVTPIVLPTDLGDHGEWHYSVSAVGDIYAAFSQAEKHILLRYSSSGVEIQKSTLQLPLFFHIQSFAFLRSGESLFLGSLPQKDSVVNGAHRGRSATVWLDQQGKNAKRYDKDGVFAYIDLRGGRIVADADKFIEVSDSEVAAFGTDGSLISRHSLSPPASDSIVSGVNVIESGRTIAVAYSHSPTLQATDSSIEDIKTLTQTWQLIDLNSGSIEKTLAMPSSFSGTALCALPSSEILYFTIRAGQPALVKTEDR